MMLEPAPDLGNAAEFLTNVPQEEKSKDMSEATMSKTVLGPDCRISGELALDNDALILGNFNGMLRVSGTLELSDSAHVQGTLVVGTLRLAGRCEADVIAEEAVELLPGAELTGQLYTTRLEVAERAVFQGDVCVGPHAMKAADEALGVEGIDQADKPIAQMPAEEPAAETEITTVPSSVDQVLQSRRPKLMSTRGSAARPRVA